MRASGKRVGRVLTPVLLVCLLALTCTVYAAPAATQKATQQANPATSALSPASMKYDPNAPPQGSITITSPQSGKTWYTGTYQVIQWTCNGTRSNLADVTLWQNNRQFAVIWTGSATGRTAYIVPLGTAPGSYELRVTSEDDTRVEAKLPVTIATTYVMLTGIPASVAMGAPYTFKWSYAGTMQSVKLALLDSSGAVVQSEPNVPIGSNGMGSWSWTMPVLPAWKSSAEYRFQISATFPTSVTSDAKAETVLFTNPLTIRLPTIQVGSFEGMAAGAPVYTGVPYTMRWYSELNGGPAKVELYSVTNSTVVQTIQASVVSGAVNVLSWSPPATLPANLYGTVFQIRVTSLAISSVQGSNGPFAIQKLVPMDVNCPVGTLINLTGTAPSGWTVFPIYNGYLQLSSVTVRNPGDTGMDAATRGQLDCFYNYGPKGGTTVQFTQMFTPLPEGQTCTKTATGAHCVPK
jgi:hypothetical protein